MNDLTFYIKVGLITLMLGAGLYVICKLLAPIAFVIVVVLTYLALIGLNKNHKTSL